jgi:hypothetical protein
MRGSWLIIALVVLPSVVVGGYYAWRRYRHWFR